MEAVGVEPTSEKRVKEGFTRVFFHLNLAVRASEEGASRVGQPYCFIQVRRKASGPFDPLKLRPDRSGGPRPWQDVTT